MYLEEYNIKLTHIEGKSNILADTFSWLPRMERPTVGKKEASGTAGQEFNFRTIEVPPQDDKDVFFFFNNNNECPELLPTVCRNEDTEVLECFLNLLALQEMPNPVTVDVPLQQIRMNNWQQFPIKVINQRNLICYRENPTEQQNWKYIYSTFIDTRCTSLVPLDIRALRNNETL